MLLFSKRLYNKKVFNIQFLIKRVTFIFGVRRPLTGRIVTEQPCCLQSDSWRGLTSTFRNIPLLTHFLRRRFLFSSRVPFPSPPHSFFPTPIKHTTFFFVNSNIAIFKLQRCARIGVPAICARDFLISVNVDGIWKIRIFVFEIRRTVTQKARKTLFSHFKLFTSPTTSSPRPSTPRLLSNSTRSPQISKKPHKKMEFKNSLASYFGTRGV